MQHNTLNNNETMSLQEGYSFGADESSLGILVELAKNGDIDPWDIDLETVTVKFLQALNNSPSDNLREAGKAIFFASVLLRMKSDILTNRANEALNVGMHHLEDDLFDELDDINQKQVSFRDLEQALKRRTVQKGKRFRTLTLEDLISALKDARDEEERRISRIQQQRLFDDILLDSYSIVEPEVSDDILELTHAENLEENIVKARAFFSEHLVSGSQVEFQTLVKYLNNWSYAFLAILFLAHEHEIYLDQSPGEFYGELRIYEPQN